MFSGLVFANSEAENSFYINGRPVFDAAGFLDQGTEEQLNSVLQQVWQKGGPQLMIITLADLGGKSIEEVSISIADKVKLGKKRDDRGVILLMSKAEKKVRIEVGDGLEGTLTDLATKRIIDYVMVPQFKQGNFSEGIRQGAFAIITQAEPEKKWLEQLDPNLQNYSGALVPGTLENFIFTLLFGLGFISVFVWIFLIFLFIKLSSLNRGGRYYSGGSGGYYGGGWGGSSGGGYSGGGGGFSGGGASGDW